MEEIQLSVMIHSPQTETTLRQLLQQFEANTKIRVNLWMLEWEQAREALNRMAIDQQGTDVSEVGTTWIPDLVSMQSLRPFEAMNIRNLGGHDAFLETAWKTVNATVDQINWAVPFLSETYAIHYRKDLLEQAGIDANSAFITHNAIEETAQKLAESGVDVPVEQPLTSDRYGTLHSLASWIWGHGGEFTTPDGRQVLFDQPNFVEGLVQYFRLLSHISAQGRIDLSLKGPDDLFRQGRSAITFGTLFLTQPREGVPQEVRQNWGVAPLPPPCFVGGSGLVVWKHTRRERAALELVRFLTSKDTLSVLAPAMVALPPRKENLSTPEIMENPIVRFMAEALTSGRSYPPARLWGMIEGRLVAELLNIANTALSDPKANLQKVIVQRMEPLTRRLNITLGQIHSLHQ